MSFYGHEDVSADRMSATLSYAYRVTNRGPQCVFTIKVNSVPNTEQQLKREVQETGLQPLRMTLLVHGLSNFTITPGIVYTLHQAAICILYSD